jgi:hypothetical protein
VHVQVRETLAEFTADVAEGTLICVAADAGAMDEEKGAHSVEDCGCETDDK